jgi:multidrug efflux pump subunit AcrA (membrane-fusion protein)
MKKMVFVIMPLIWLTSCSEAPAERDIATAVRPAKLYTVQAFDQAREYRLFARIANRETIDLKFEIAGQLAALPIREGAKIKRGGRLGSD